MVCLGMQQWEKNSSILGAPNNEGIPNLTIPLMSPSLKAKPIATKRALTTTSILFKTTFNPFKINPNFLTKK